MASEDARNYLANSENMDQLIRRYIYCRKEEQKTGEGTD